MLDPHFTVSDTHAMLGDPVLTLSAAPTPEVWWRRWLRKWRAVWEVLWR